MPIEHLEKIQQKNSCGVEEAFIVNDRSLIHAFPKVRTYILIEFALVDEGLHFLKVDLKHKFKDLRGFEMVASEHRNICFRPQLSQLTFFQI